MNKLPGVLVLIDVRREHIAAKEAGKLNIPVIGIVDTDSDPDFVDIVIPGNDDAMRAIELILNEMADAVEEGKRARPETSQQPRTSVSPGLKAARVPMALRRVTARAEDAPAPAGEEPAAQEPHAGAEGSPAPEVFSAT